MTAKPRRRRPGRTIYVGIHFNPTEVQQLVSMCGLLRFDIDLTPTKEEMRDAIRELVSEALESRLQQASKQRLNRARRIRKTPRKSSTNGDVK